MNRAITAKDWSSATPSYLSCEELVWSLDAQFLARTRLIASVYCHVNIVGDLALRSSRPTSARIAHQQFGEVVVRDQLAMDNNVVELSVVRHRTSAPQDLVPLVGTFEASAFSPIDGIYV